MSFVLKISVFNLYFIKTSKAFKYIFISMDVLPKNNHFVDKEKFIL